MSWINPKLDWKESDFYNAEDLNRVENNTYAIADELMRYMYNVPLESVIVDRTMDDIDFISSINRIERNINIIKAKFLTPTGWKDMKVWAVGKGFTYHDAKRLEKNLDLLYSMLQLAKKNFKYSGTFTCGADWEGGLY